MFGTSGKNLMIWSWTYWHLLDVHWNQFRNDCFCLLNKLTKTTSNNFFIHVIKYILQHSCLNITLEWEIFIDSKMISSEPLISSKLDQSWKLNIIHKSILCDHFYSSLCYMSVSSASDISKSSRTKILSSNPARPVLKVYSDHHPILGRRACYFFCTLIRMHLCIAF